MKRIMSAAAIILAAALSRLLPHPPNFTPLAAMALAGGVYLDRRFALVIPLAALFLSDCIIGFHNTILFVYGSFAAIGFIGLWLKSHKKPAWIFAAAVGSSVLFFVVTNFAVWALDDGSFYPKTIPGLISCYIAAIPFFRNTMLGDIVYSAVVFGVFELVERTLRADVPAVSTSARDDHDLK